MKESVQEVGGGGGGYLVPGGHVVIVPALLVDGGVPPDGSPRLAVPRGAGDAPRLHVWGDALLLPPLLQGHPVVSGQDEHEFV